MEKKVDVDLVLAVLLPGASEEERETSLAAFNEQNCTVFRFDVADQEKRKELCEGLLNILKTGTKSSCQLKCLEALRILSRDKKVLIPVACKENLQVLLRLARLDPGQEGLGEELHFPVIVEALKCLCNIVFNSPVAQKLSLELNVAAALCKLLQLCQDDPNTHTIRSFTLRLLFLLSLLHTDIRTQLRNELQALPLLTHVLEDTLSIRWLGKYEAAEDNLASPHSLKDIDCAIEALKALFNVTLDSWNVHSESDAQQFRSLTAILRHCLLTTAPTENKTEDLHSNTVNLLSNVPVSCLDVLISPEAQEGSMVYNGINMEAIQALLDFMEKRIDEGSSYRERLTPVLTLLTDCSRAHRNIRKFIKAQVLPPLRDVSNRPEVGTTIRNKLVRLMTNVDLGVKQIAAEFLFVLCKERVDSLLKYTGYGNAAGLLAARGLLAGGRGDHWYSDDEDTDTEEYRSAKPNINLITGHVEEPMPNPLDEMTEEQKEYEAMKLVHMFDRLSRDEVIKPMGMRSDGSVAPLEDLVYKSSNSDTD
ncbi:chaperone Ric-8B isoform X2 [Microcaecilia unicolor]|uniref:Synembryn n=1 Tax=Microcaecilia unicolor TaxID=1415580 RepID=A0A6P7Z2W0_9AMPH|nr:synembryn-B isoform X2 [Microcaecilia unicolor]